MVLSALGATLVPGSVLAHPEIQQQITDLTHRLEEHPGDARLLARRGELHRVHQDWPAAEADFRAALTADPTFHTARFLLGRVKLESGHPGQALPLLDAYLDARPADGEALAVRADARLARGDALGAARDLDEAIRHPRGETARPEHYLARARALMAAGPEHRAEAIRGLDEGLTSLGDAVTLELFALELEIDGGSYDAALTRLDHLASRASRKEPWLMRRGAVLEAAGRPQQALTAYRTALDSIEALPASRRTNRAVKRLEDEARTAVERLRVEPATR